MVIFTNVRKSFGKQNVLNDVSFHVFPGERVGLVGPNGMGKSTIFRIINNEITPDKGEIRLRKGARIGHLKQQFQPAELGRSVADYTTTGVRRLHALSGKIAAIEDRLAAGNLKAADRTKALDRLGTLQTQFEQAGGYSVHNAAETALCGLGFRMKDLTRPISEFSGGWRMRAELARVLISDPDLLLLDEPTNFLDLPAIEWLHDFLKTFAGTMILISHDRYLLNAMAAVTFELFNGRIERYPGAYEYYVKTREERNVQRLAAKKNQDQKREKMERVIERFRTKATKASQARSMMKKLEKMEEIEAPSQDITGAGIRLIDPPRCGPNIVELTDASKTYDGTNWVYRDINITVNNGEKIGVVGTNGMGKTTLLRILAGHLPIEVGKRRQGHNVVIGYHSQDYLETMNPADTVFAVAKQANPALSEAEIRRILGSFGFHGDDVSKTVEVLSGGEKVRLSLARQLLNPPNFLLLDEPTTHLDIPSRIALQDALGRFTGTVCLVSHDITFIRQVADVIYEVSESGLTKYFGDYAYYRRKKKEEAETVNTPGPSSPARGDTPQQTSPRASETAAEKKARKRLEAQQRQKRNKVLKPLQQKLGKIERQLNLLEKREAEISLRFEDDLDAAALQQINQELQRNAFDQNQLLKEWETLSAELEVLQAELGE